MNRTLNVSWLTAPAPGNFGDILTPYILSKYGYNVNFVRWNNIEKADTICIGSIARLAKKGIRVMGSGIISKNEIVDPEANWIWARGPLTRNRVTELGGQCPEIYGDPALLLPRLVSGCINKQHKIGLVPHHIDYDAVKKQYPNYKIINLISADVEGVIADITSCEQIISSSLHGIIVANAYGIPASWIRVNKLVGDDIKFHDYARSVNVDIKVSTVSDPNWINPTINTNQIHQILLDGNFK
jgi:pyruvyltransferase